MRLDPLTDAVMSFYLACGPALGVILTSIIFLAITLLFDTFEGPRRRIRRPGLPIYKNYSTMIDFGILNPIAILFIIHASRGLYQLPNTLDGLALLPLNTVHLLSKEYHEQIVWGWSGIGIFAAIAVAFWIIYIIVDQLKTRNTQKNTKLLSFTGFWIAFVTILFMYLILSFAFRAIIAYRYIDQISVKGFFLDPTVWNLATDALGNVTKGINLVAMTFLIIIMLIIMQDLWLYRHQYQKRRIRVFAGITLAIIIWALSLGPIFTVHYNLVNAKAKAIRVALNAHRTMHAGRVTWSIDNRSRVRIETIKELPVWIVRTNAEAIPITMQIFVILVPFISEGVRSVIQRKRKRGGPQDSSTG